MSALVPHRDNVPLDWRIMFKDVLAVVAVLCETAIHEPAVTANTLTVTLVLCSCFVSVVTHKDFKVRSEYCIELIFRALGRDDSTFCQDENQHQSDCNINLAWGGSGWP